MFDGAYDSDILFIYKRCRKGSVNCVRLSRSGNTQFTKVHQSMAIKNLFAPSSNKNKEIVLQSLRKKIE